MEIAAIKEEYVPQTIEFKVQDDFVKKLPQILSNVAQIKQWAIERTEEDRVLVLVTEEDFEAGKKRCAEINRIIQTIDAKRKDVKKSYNEPYEIFEKSIKEVLEVLKNAKDNLWGQVTAAEELAKNEKLEELKEYYASLNCEWRTFEQIFDKTWLNKGKKVDSIKKEIDEIATKLVSEANIIDSLHSEYDVALKVRYKDGYSLGEVINYNNQLIEQNRAVQAAKSNYTREPEKPVETLISEPEAEELITIDFRVQCTPTALTELGRYMKTHGIKYSKIV